MNKVFLLFSGLVLASGSVNAQVSFESEILRSSKVYEADESSSNVFNEVSRKIVEKIAWGKANNPDGKTIIQPIVDNLVPGKSRSSFGRWQGEGHSILKLSKEANGDINVSVDAEDELYYSENGRGWFQGSKVQFRAPAIFTHGSWDDFIAGNEIELSLTDAGQSAALEAHALSLIDYVKVNKIFTDFNQVVVWVEYRNPYILKGNKNRLEMMGEGMSVKVDPVRKGSGKF